MPHNKPHQTRPRPKPTSFTTVLFLNFAVVVVFSMIIISGNLLIILKLFGDSSLCISPIPRAIGTVVVLLLSLHLVWHHLPMNTKRKLRSLGKPIVFVIILMELLQPSKLPTLALWSIVVVIGVLTWGISLSSFSPFFVQEPALIASDFSVDYVNEPTQKYRPGEKIQVARGNFILVEVETSSISAHCKWTTIKGGLTPGPSECTTQYTAPLVKSDDILTVYVQSLCKTRSSFANLSILVP